MSYTRSKYWEWKRLASNILCPKL